MRAVPMLPQRAERLGEEDHRAVVLWAAECAEAVLPCFTSNCPHDDRPRAALEAARAWARGEIRTNAARLAAFAAHAAARDARDPGARAAARAAGHAAASAHVARHARHAAAYARAAVKHNGIARDEQVTRLPEHLRRFIQPASDPK